MAEELGIRRKRLYVWKDRYAELGEAGLRRRWCYGRRIRHCAMRCSKLAGGITGLRDMGSPLEDILQLREETDDGTTLGPHLVVAGPIVQGPLPFKMPQFISVKDPTEARQTVDMLRTRGVDFIKVQDAIPHDIYAAVADEAHREHMSWGILPRWVPTLSLEWLS